MSISIAQHLGVSRSTGKKRRKPKPGGDVLAKLTHAHGRGDFAAAKRHALDYAKAVHGHLSSHASTHASQAGADEPAARPTPPTPSTSTNLSQLAALMRARKR